MAFAYQIKARNPGNTVAATNPMFDHVCFANIFASQKCVCLAFFTIQSTFFPCVMYTITYSEYMYTVLVHQTVKESIFLIYMEYLLQSMYNHMVGRAGSILSPFYSILLG